MRAVNVKNQQIRIKREHIVVHGPHKQLRAKSPYGFVLDDEINMGETFLKVLGNHCVPMLPHNRLAIEQNTHGVAFLRRAGCHQRHAALKVFAVL